MPAVNVQTPLPDVNQTVTITGNLGISDDPIVIACTAPGTCGSGLTLRGANSSVAGISLVGFDKGIELNSANNAIIQKCRLGVNALDDPIGNTIGIWSNSTCLANRKGSHLLAGRRLLG